MNPADFDLIQKCLVKDTAAWDEFVNRYTNLIYDAIIRTFERYGYPGQPDVLADLHNDIFVLIIDEDCRVLKQFEGRNGCQLGHYLRTVAVRRTVDFLRKMRPVVSLDTMDDDSVHTCRPQDGSDLAFAAGAVSLVNHEQQGLLQQFISELKKPERELCQLLLGDELSPQMIARQLGISVDYFYVRKKRLMDKLKLMAALKDAQRLRGGVPEHE